MLLDSVLEYASSLNDDLVCSFSEADNAYILDGKKEFTCPSCGDIVSYGECSCGTMWNVYCIYENSSIKTVARIIDTKLMLQKTAKVNQEDAVFDLL